MMKQDDVSTERVYREARQFDDDTAREMFASSLLYQVRDIAHHSHHNFAAAEAEYVIGEALGNAAMILGDYSIVSEWLKRGIMMMNSGESINAVTEYIQSVSTYLPRRITEDNTVPVPVFLLRSPENSVISYINVTMIHQGILFSVGEGYSSSPSLCTMIHRDIIGEVNHFSDEGSVNRTLFPSHMVFTQLP